MQPTVTLVNWTPHPLETNWILWEASKVDGPLPTMDAGELAKLVQRQATSTVPVKATNGCRIPTIKDMEKLFWDVLRQHIPVAEHISFVFMLDGISVSLREQMVRHRIGTHVGDRLGVDIIPDLADSTWWSQSMRIQDMGTFADREMYRIPDSIKDRWVDRDSIGDPNVKHQVSLESMYKRTMDVIQNSYNDLVKAGVPMEDARELIPLGAQHRISWGLNLQSLLHILSKRGCWILQLGIWGPIIHGMVDELATKVHPMFRRIVAPPCIGGDGKFNSCLYREENRRRMDGSDNHSPCPLYLCRDEAGRTEFTMKADPIGMALSEPKDILVQLKTKKDLVPRQEEMLSRSVDYHELWGHDPFLWDKEE